MMRRLIDIVEFCWLYRALAPMQLVKELRQAWRTGSMRDIFRGVVWLVAAMVLGGLLYACLAVFVLVDKSLKMVNWFVDWLLQR